MKKILGLDLGTNSIGWAIVQESSAIPDKILGMGSRIIPLNSDESDEFSKGNAISKNMNRTIKRTIRKGYDRYGLRRKALKQLLVANGMMPDEELLIKIRKERLFELRDKAVKGQISLKEIGRIFLQLNQRRGYKSSRKDESTDKNITEYEQSINDRFSEIHTQQKTIGQYFFTELSDNPHFRVKEKVFPRKAYIEEFQKIWDTQALFYPSIFTAIFKAEIQDKTIYYQRDLKSQKDLVSFCEFEGNYFTSSGGKMKFAGPRVAPLSSPIAQVCKIWESINNISIKSRKGEDFIISTEKKKEIFEFLDTHEKILQPELFKILGLGKNEGYYANALIAKKGLQGNTTKTALFSVLSEDFHAPLLRFNTDVEEYETVDKITGELLVRKKITDKFENEPLYRLWHTIYSLPNDDDIISTLIKKFGIPGDKAKVLAKLDFNKSGFTKKSARAMRKILPYLQDGFKYSDACLMTGYNHSNCLTTEENLQRQLIDKLPLLSKNSLRQPVVEKILNQMINLVNAVIEKYGKPDEIRIELARELKQNKEERNETFRRINETERYHDKIRKHLTEHPYFQKKKVTRRDIERYKLWEEFDGVSPYEPSKIISLADLFSGLYDIEHIIPKSKLFDDSFGNKTICPRHLNSGQSGKNNMTAYDFMNYRSPNDLEEYLKCVENNKKISRTKREKLLMAADKIPADFIARQLRETQYIARKAKEILLQSCRHVHTTSGRITETLRRLWGWDDIIMNLQLSKYKELGKTEWIEWGANGSPIRKEIITGWSKRDDHRHHAIDALTVACTDQGFIQRISSLNSQHTKDEIFNELKNGRYNQKLSLLDNYLVDKKPFTNNQVQEATSLILISYKAGKKVATWGKRMVKKNGKKVIVQNNILIPRGALSEESVYGKINKSVLKEVRLGPSFTDADKISNKEIKMKIKERLAAFDNDPAKAFKNLQKNPIWLKDQIEQINKVTIMVDQPEYVIKYPVQNITIKDLGFVIDPAVRKAIEKRLAAYNNNPKEAYKNLSDNPIWLNEKKQIPIKSVRCYTGLNVVAGIKVEDKVQHINYDKYVKPGSNHHIAIYKDENGKRQEHVVTFWHAVERKKYGIPVVITNTKEVWDNILKKGIDDQDFLSKLPSDQWKYEFSMQQNEMFVFGMSQEEVQQFLELKDYKAISNNLFRVRKITSGNYWFNHHCETTPRENMEDKKTGRCIQASLSGMTGIKIKINNLGVPETTAS